MVEFLLIVAAVLQCVAVAYALYLMLRRQGATGAWLCLLGGLASMLTWRLVIVSGATPPAFFNPLIAIWGSTFMVAAMFLFGREVAARQRAEIERDALLASERAARTQAEHAAQAKDEFLATLSHELRSPLAAILGWCAVLLRNPGSAADVERAVRTIKRNARAQSRLVDDLLDMTRMRAGSLRLNVVTVPLDAPVLAAIQVARPLADAKSLQLALDAPDTPNVEGDPDRLRQIVTNLLENAIKFTPPGGSITVSLRAIGDQAELAVTDTGEGIDPDFLPNVFARFRQADSSTTRRHGGLGLGLSIVDHLVRMHDGTVRAESKGLGQGATFTALFPLANGEVEGVDREAHRLRSGPPLADRPLAGLRVLIVDDEEDVRTATQRLLEYHGAAVAALDSGRAVRDWLIRYRPDVLVCDIGMPGEDGYSLIRRVRGLPEFEGGSTPAISLTAHARIEDRDRALAAGFNEHLAKPVDVPRLVSSVRALAGSPSKVLA